MNWKNGLAQPGVATALAAAALFGAGMPLAKYLLRDMSPWMLAALLYLGSGTGLAVYRMIVRAPSVHLLRGELPWFAGAVVAGGIVAPVLLMVGLLNMPASGASLLLNAEGVFTALLAWFVFKENFDRRIACGMLAISAGALILSWPDQAGFAGFVPALAILGACLAWAFDNNLTRKVSLTDASWIASVKGLVSGAVNLTLAVALGATLPDPLHVGAAMLVGLLAYGMSLSLFVVALRHLGTARTGAYFSTAPFLGAALALLMGEAPTLALLAAGMLMAVGLWLHLTERHEHIHTHEEMEHEHAHTHEDDEHHRHTHPFPVAPGVEHTHKHSHGVLTHAHAHFPDMHHRHKH
ncbi:DMT family transporter [Herbaspirillum sp. RV1423]|uniref:DMT family transporter n=1 Tax=Herbaspirillum sp. RV1423 TaxID=1443993 RepID=UPI0004ACC342|nr:DMT family transporter [Herbaspirillum sp. RV1423]